MTGECSLRTYLPEIHSVCCRVGLSASRIDADALQGLTLDYAIRRIEPQKPDSRFADLREGFNRGAAKSEMRVPGVNARVEQPHKRLLRPDDRTDIRSLRAVTAFTG